MTSDDDEPVGYGRPPKKTQFRRGSSGNPKGRPGRARNVATELRLELATTISVRENGREAKLSKGAALAKSLVARALKGDMRALAMIRLILPDSFGALPDDPANAAVRESDATILERLLNRHRQEVSGEEKLPSRKRSESPDEESN